MAIPVFGKLGLQPCPTAMQNGGARCLGRLCCKSCPQQCTVNALLTDPTATHIAPPHGCVSGVFSSFRPHPHNPAFSSVCFAACAVSMCAGAPLFGPHFSTWRCIGSKTCNAVCEPGFSTITGPSVTATCAPGSEQWVVSGKCIPGEFPHLIQLQDRHRLAAHLQLLTSIGQLRCPGSSCSRQQRSSTCSTKQAYAPRPPPPLLKMFPGTILAELNYWKGPALSSARGGARHTPEIKNATGTDGWLGGDFDHPHTRPKNGGMLLGLQGTLMSPWLSG